MSTKPAWPTHADTSHQTPTPHSWMRVLVVVAMLSVTFITAAPAPSADATEIYGQLLGYGNHNGGGFSTRSGGYERWEWTPAEKRLEASTAHGTLALDERAEAWAAVHSAFIADQPFTHFNLIANWKGRVDTPENSVGTVIATARLRVRVYEVNPNTFIPTEVREVYSTNLMEEHQGTGAGANTLQGSVNDLFDLGEPLEVGKSYRIEMRLTCKTFTSVIFGNPATCDFQFTPNTSADNGYGAFLDRWWFEDHAVPTPTCNGLEATVLIEQGQLPTQGDDVIIGTPGDDEINALGGNDTVCALGGNDLVRGGDGDDTVLGGDGNDRLWGAKGADVLHGEAGDDALHGNRGNDTLYGHDGDDKLFGYSEDDYLDGGQGMDRLHGNRGNDTLLGGADDDALFGYADDDTLLGGAGNDLLGGNFGNDTLLGEIGNDTLYGSDGNDEVRGGDGDDIVQGNSSDDMLYGDAGDDTLDGGINNDLCDGGTGTDTATRCETATGIP